MKILRISNTLQPLLSVVALVIAFTCLGLSNGQAFAFNLYRDFISYNTAAEISVNNAQSNFDICAPVAASETDLPWLGEALAGITEANAQYDYLEQFDYYASAYSSYFRYLGYNNPSNLLAYLELGNDYDEAYREQSEIYGESFSEASSEAYLDYFEAVQANAPQDYSEFPAYLEGIYEVEYSSWIALYGTWWTGNDYYYATSAADYAYSLWSFYGAPSYATSLYLGGLSSAYYDLKYNAIRAGNYQIRLDYYPEAAPEEAYDSMVEYYNDYYDPILDYYNAYSSYYRDISEFTEG